MDLVYTLFVGSFYTVDLSQSRFGSFVYAHASDWFFSFLSHMFCPSLSFKTFGMFLAPPVLDLMCIRTLDLRLLCFCSHFGYQAKKPCCCLIFFRGIQSTVCLPPCPDCIMALVSQPIAVALLYGQLTKAANMEGGDSLFLSPVRNET